MRIAWLTSRRLLLGTPVARWIRRSVLVLPLLGCGSTVEDRAPIGGESSSAGGSPATGGNGTLGPGAGATSTGGATELPCDPGTGAQEPSGGMGASAGGAPPSTLRRLKESHCAACDDVRNPTSNTQQCGEFTHRVFNAACPSMLPRGVELPATGLDDECHGDGECTQKPNGYCGNLSNGHGGASGNVCGYGCRTEQDCAPGQVCDCGTLTGHCMDASCKTDAECGPGLLCVLTSVTSGCYSSLSFYTCQTPKDECRAYRDCPTGICTWQGDRFVCAPNATAMCPVG